MRPGAAAPLLALVASLLLACGSSVGQGSKRLQLEAPRWWFSHLPVAVVVSPSGLLAEHDVTVSVAVGADAAGRWELKKAPKKAKTRLWIPGSSFVLGPNQVAVKTGTERSEAVIAVVSVGWLLALIAIVAALAGLLFRRWRGRRSG